MLDQGILLGCLIGVLSLISKELVFCMPASNGQRGSLYTVLLPEWMTASMPLSSSSSSMTLWLSSADDLTNVTVRQFEQPHSHTLSLEGSDPFALPLTHLADAHQEGITGYLIDSPVEINLDFTLPGPCSPGGLLPLASPGLSFVLSAMKPRNFVRTVLYVIGTQNNTRVNITEPQEGAQRDTPQAARYKHIMEISLGADNIVTYNSLHDITGFRVTADKPVAVFIQTDWKKIHWDGTEHWLSPQLPVHLWGCSFMDKIPSDSNLSQVYRITALSLQTHVQFYTGVRSGTLHLMYSTQTDVHVSPEDEYILLRADKLILVTRFQEASILSPNTACHSTALQPIPSMDKWRRNYRIRTLQDESLWIIVINAQNFDNFMIDHMVLEQYINQSLEYSQFSLAEDSFSLCNLNVSAGIHDISSGKEDFLIFSPSINLAPQLGSQVSQPQCQPQDTGYQILRKNPSDEPKKAAKNKPLFVYHVETLGDKGVYAHIDLHQEEQPAQAEEVGSGPSIIAVVVSLSVAVLFVVLCIAGFVVMDIWSKRQTIGRVKVAPYNDPY